MNKRPMKRYLDVCHSEALADLRVQGYSDEKFVNIKKEKVDAAFVNEVSGNSKRPNVKRWVTADAGEDLWVVSADDPAADPAP